MPIKVDNNNVYNLTGDPNEHFDLGLYITNKINQNNYLFPSGISKLLFLKKNYCCNLIYISFLNDFIKIVIKIYVKCPMIFVYTN